MARCEPRSASVTRSKRPFSRTWNFARHSSSTAAPRRAASQAASRYSFSSCVIMTPLSAKRQPGSVVLDLDAAVAREPHLDLVLAVVELQTAPQTAADL